MNCKTELLDKTLRIKYICKSVIADIEICETKSIAENENEIYRLYDPYDKYYRNLISLKDELTDFKLIADLLNENEMLEVTSSDLSSELKELKSKIKTDAESSA